MKTKIPILIIALLLVHAATAADYLLVRFFPDNKPYVGLTNYPSQVQPSESSEIVAGWVTNMTKANYQSYVDALLPVYRVGESNALYQSKLELDSKIEALAVAYSNLQWCADNWASVTNLTTLRIAVKAEGDVLLKLGPVLKELYKP